MIKAQEVWCKGDSRGTLRFVLGTTIVPTSDWYKKGQPEGSKLNLSNDTARTPGQSASDCQCWKSFGRQGNYYVQLITFSRIISLINDCMIFVRCLSLLSDRTPLLTSIECVYFEIIRKNLNLKISSISRNFVHITWNSCYKWDFMTFMPIFDFTQIRRF